MAWPKTSRHARGYGAEWVKLREVVLRRDKYLCQCDRCKGGALRLTVATEVDHVVSKAEWQRRRGSLAGCDDLGNLSAIGHECHKRKTAEEVGRTVRPTIGADGYPVEG